VIADIDMNRFDVARHFGVYIDVLKGFEGAGNSERVAQVATLHDGYGRGCSGRMSGIVCFGARAADPVPGKERRNYKKEESNRQILFRHAFFPGEMWRRTHGERSGTRHPQKLNEGL
jgi:hypothetical protein